MAVKPLAAPVNAGRAPAGYVVGVADVAASAGARADTRVVWVGLICGLLQSVTAIEGFCRLARQTRARPT
jgi:hypothetical protein